jgi:zinc protease
MKSIFLAAASVWLSAAALCHAQTNVTSVEGITEYRLDNGLRVLLFPDPSKPTVTVNITYLVGSVNEKYGETGMAHLLEHLMFKGTTKHADIWKELKDHGAQFNGTTWYERTNYFETLASSDENLRWALEMEADRMVNSRISKKDLDSEMTVVRNEFEQGENSPTAVLMQRVLSSAFVWHNYGKSTIGARADIEHVPIEHLQAFYRRYYQPDNAMLVLAGKFDQARTLAWIKELFGPIPHPARQLEHDWTSEPTQDGERTVTVRRVGDVQVIDVAYHVPAGTHPDFPAIEVLGTLLGDSPSGRLYKALVDNKKASSVEDMEFQLRQPGFVMFSANVRKENSLDDARNIMLGDIEGIAKEPPSAEEVERIRTKMLKQIDLALNNSGRIGVELTEWAAMGDWRMFFLYRDRIKQVTPDDVKRVAAAYFKDSNRTVGVFIPTEKPDRAEIPEAPDVQAALKDYKGQAAVAAGEAFDPSPANIDARTTRAALANGMKLALLSKKTRGNDVTAAINLHFGDLKILMGRSTAGVLVASMLIRGAQKHDRQQIQDEFDKLKAQVRLSGTATGAQASIQTTRANLPAVLRLVAEILRQPAFPDTEFEQIRQARLASIENMRHEPQFQAMNELQRHLTRYPADDVRAVKTADEEAANFKQVTLAEVRQFYQDFYGASNAEMAVVGDFDAAEIQKLAGELFGDWKSPRPFTRVTSEYRQIDPVNRSIESPDKANAMFAAGARLKLDDEDPDFPALLLANFMIGGNPSSRLMNRWRHKEGWSYGGQSVIHAGTREPSGSFLAVAILNPQNVLKVENAFHEEMDKVMKEGFTAQEVAEAKNALQQEHIVSRSEDRNLVSKLAGNEFFSRTMAWDAALEKKIDALTPDQVVDAVRRRLDLKTITIVKAGDFKKAGITN